jgi:hypothetical protein
MSRDALVYSGVGVDQLVVAFSPSVEKFIPGKKMFNLSFSINTDFSGYT